MEVTLFAFAAICALCAAALAFPHFTKNRRRASEDEELSMFMRQQQRKSAERQYVHAGGWDGAKVREQNPR